MKVPPPSPTILRGLELIYQKMDTFERMTLGDGCTCEPMDPPCPSCMDGTALRSALRWIDQVLTHKEK